MTVSFWFPNLIPFLNNKLNNKTDAPHEALYWRFWQQSAIRMGDWKYLQAGERTYLFNVETDQHENKNLIDQYPDKAKMMKQKLKTWAADLFHPGLPQGAIGREKGFFDHYFN